MLILARERNESICIGDDIRITVLNVKKGTVRLGITAPKETIVHREEIYKRIKKERTK